MTSSQTIRFPAGLAKFISKLSYPYNRQALISVILSGIFVSYLPLNILNILPENLLVIALFLVAIPVAAFALSIISLVKTNPKDTKSIIVSYVSFGITGLYFITIAAMISCFALLYILYAYVL